MIEVHAPTVLGEVREGDDLVAPLVDSLGPLADGDIVAVTSKVVSKAEGRLRRGTTRDAELPGETLRVVARRGATTIVRNRLGLTMAAGGIDASNVETGSVLLLPEDPDASARRLRESIAERAGVNVGVIVTDTAGRAWRDGQTDIAIGAAGLLVVEEFAGRTDAYGNPLQVTAPALADELAGAAELAQGKLTNRPFARIRGRAELVLPPGEHGTGAVRLIRPEGGDFFGLGAREAVVRALRGDPADQPPFGAPASAEDLAIALAEVTGHQPTVAGDALVVEHGEPTAVRTLAFAFGWTATPDGDVTAPRWTLRPPTPPA